MTPLRPFSINVSFSEDYRMQEAGTWAANCATEVAHGLTIECPSESLYRVEVSGWDENQSFFAEKSELEWNEESGKRVALGHALADGAVVFLRLMQPISTGWSHPVAYETEFVGKTAAGQHCFRLYAACPRMEQPNGSVN
jgi:hypothetical protein